jgi:hypothetical protein
MSDRLRQIWSGFESVTTRKLTGRGVAGIVVPTRQDLLVEDEMFLREDYRAPAEAAFAALRQQLASAEKRAKRNGETFDPKEAPPLSESAFNGDTEAARDLIRGLKATEARVRRSDVDYADTLGANGRRKRLFGKSSQKAKAPKAPKLAIKRKKFLGIF